MTADSERQQLAPAARLLGRLLVRELDADTVTELRTPAVADALVACGISLPEPADLPQLAHEWCDRFLHPGGCLPPVQSLWLEGQYDGDCKRALAATAAAAALEPAPGARGAPVDQLGCILLLWAELITDRPELAARLQRDHLAWASRALAPTVARGGFYGDVAAAAIRFVADVTAQ